MANLFYRGSQSIANAFAAIKPADPAVLESKSEAVCQLASVIGLSGPPEQALACAKHLEIALGIAFGEDYEDSKIIDLAKNLQQWAGEAVAADEAFRANTSDSPAIPDGLSPPARNDEIRSRACGLDIGVTERRFTAAQCRNLLANGLINNLRDTTRHLKDKRNQGGINFTRLYGNYTIHNVGVQKLAALLVYFRAQLDEGVDDEDNGRVITFETIKGPDLRSFETTLHACDVVLVPEDTDVVRIHDGPMEEPDAEAFVNFANSNFGYGRFIASCTQEEILQMCCPEFNVGMLFIGTMEDDEVVNVLNCRRYSKYTGYLDTIQCTGPVEEHSVQHILTLDACINDHFKMSNILRDIRKAFTSFVALPEGSRVSTGKWGCGVFGGVPAHKFMQQVIAARAAGVQLRFSTFSDPVGCDKLLKALQSSKTTVAQAMYLLAKCKNRETFVEDALTHLR